VEHALCTAHYAQLWQMCLFTRKTVDQAIDTAHSCDFWTSQICVSLRAVPTARKLPRPDQATEHTLSGAAVDPSSHSLCTRDVAADHRYTHVPAGAQGLACHARSDVTMAFFAEHCPI
jgi:hypothetical protein